MIRALLLATVLVATAAGCKRDSTSGLPPAKEWTGTKDQAEPVEGTTQPPATNPHAGMAGAGGDPSNPHAGMPGAGGDPSNPHAGMPGAGGDPSGGGMATSSPTAPKALDKLPDGRLVLGPFALKLPDGWTAKPVTSSMRAAEFTVGADGSNIIVYYFGESGAGSVKDNTDRWLSQFERSDGKTAAEVAKIEQTKFGGQDATTITTTGKFHAESMMAGQPAQDFPDGELLAAIVNSPAGPYYFKGVGSKATMDANAAKFRAMLSSLEIH
jgi:hypothetical protein|nr:hypothetical protein [Kofleriaceae bacterium]